MPTQDAFAALRRDYVADGLSAATVAADPVEQFGIWMDAAVAAGLSEPNAMVLATADAAGRPSSRAVLLKAFDERGFVFYTNLESRKGRELAANPWASLCFVWMELRRQVRIEGPTQPVSAAESDAYFASRPREAQLAAVASPQSSPLPDRVALEARLAEAAAAAGPTVARPPHWGGVRVRPEAMEFWQGRPHRLHDRLQYRRADGGWVIERLAP